MIASSQAFSTDLLSTIRILKQMHAQILYKSSYSIRRITNEYIT